MITLCVCVCPTWQHLPTSYRYWIRICSVPRIITVSSVNFEHIIQFYPNWVFSLINTIYGIISGKFPITNYSNSFYKVNCVNSINSCKLVCYSDCIVKFHWWFYSIDWASLFSIIQLASIRKHCGAAQLRFDTIQSKSFAISYISVLLANVLNYLDKSSHLLINNNDNDNEMFIPIFDPSTHYMLLLFFTVISSILIICLTIFNE